MKYRLDETIAFVNKVSAFMRGEAKVEECVEILVNYEKKWNLIHISPPLETYIEDFTIKTKKPRELSHIIGLPEKEEEWNLYVEGTYFNFLSDTNLVLEALAFSDSYDIIFANRYSFQATARAWAKMYSDWANTVSWLGRTSWSYVDFYSFEVCEGHRDWCDAVLEIIKEKTAMPLE